MTCSEKRLLVMVDSSFVTLYLLYIFSKKIFNMIFLNYSYVLTLKACIYVASLVASV